MWVKHGHRTEESKKGAGYFSGSADSQWGTSSASYAKSIRLLNSNAWEEIENGALEFTKLGKRFKPSLVVMDACACIMDCDSDDSDSYSFTRHDDTSLQEHGALQAERAAKESGNFCDKDTSNFPSPAASDSQIQTGTHSALQPTGPMDTCQDRFSSTILLGGPGMQGTNEEVSPDTSRCWLVRTIKSRSYGRSPGTREALGVSPDRRKVDRSSAACPDEGHIPEVG